MHIDMHVCVCMCVCVCVYVCIYLYLSISIYIAGAPAAWLMASQSGTTLTWCGRASLEASRSNGTPTVEEPRIRLYLSIDLSIYWSISISISISLSLPLFLSLSLSSLSINIIYLPMSISIYIYIYLYLSMYIIYTCGLTQGIAVWNQIDLVRPCLSRSVPCHRHSHRWGTAAVDTQHEGCMRPSGRCVWLGCVQKVCILW